MPQRKPQYRRSDRIATQIQKDLSVLIRDEIPDSSRHLLGIAAIELTVDYSHATVYINLIKANLEERESIVNQLNQASSWLRRCLSKKIRLHHTPELHFRYDDHTERSSSLLGLIDKALERTAVSAALDTSPVPDVKDNISH